MSHDHDHSHDHSHHHHHSHSHGHSHGSGEASGAEMSMEEKLNTLFSHWIDHNDSHKDNFISWASKAREAGLNEVADSLDQAGSLSDQVTQNLKKALEKLNG